MVQHLDDTRLLAETKEVARSAREATARVLEYLMEVDRRRLWAVEGYGSLQDFCIRFLGYSETEAWRRIQSARCVAKVPEVLPLLQNSALSLTAVSLIAPHITTENAAAILPQVEGQSSRKVIEVLRENFEEARAKPEWLSILLDEELKSLMEDVKKEFSEKNPAELLKKAFKKILSRKPRQRKVPVKHTRYVTAAMRREVKAESGHQCEYKAPSGVRCSQTAHLQVDHVRAWAKGGSSRTKENLRPLCRVHNLLRGKLDFPHWQTDPAPFRKDRTKENPLSPRGDFPVTPPRAREVQKQNVRP